MTGRQTPTTDQLDSIGRQLLAALQTDARKSFTELARQVGLTPPAVAERIRRLENAGLIQGYRAEVNRAALGYGLCAFVRIRALAGRDADVEAFAAETPEVLECHEVTGEDSYLLKVAAGSVQHLDRVITALAPFGATRSVMVLSTKVAGKTLMPLETTPA